MTKTADSYTHWFIFDGHGPVDGEMYEKYDALLRSASWYSDPGYTILAFDTKAWAAGVTQLVDVTREVARDWWDDEGCRDTMELVRAGDKVSFLANEFRTEVEQMEAEINGDATRADQWRDERVQAGE